MESAHYRNPHGCCSANSVALMVRCGCCTAHAHTRRVLYKCDTDTAAHLALLTSLPATHGPRQCTRHQ
jgi:hypothetical protein